MNNTEINNKDTTELATKYHKDLSEHLDEHHSNIKKLSDQPANLNEHPDQHHSNLKKLIDQPANLIFLQNAGVVGQNVRDSVERAIREYIRQTLINKYLEEDKLNKAEIATRVGQEENKVYNKFDKDKKISNFLDKIKTLFTLHLGQIQNDAIGAIPIIGEAVNLASNITSTESDIKGIKDTYTNIFKELNNPELLKDLDESTDDNESASKLTGSESTDDTEGYYLSAENRPSAKSDSVKEKSPGGEEVPPSDEEEKSPSDEEEETPDGDPLGSPGGEEVPPSDEEEETPDGDPSGSPDVEPLEEPAPTVGGGYFNRGRKSKGKRCKTKRKARKSKGKRCKTKRKARKSKGKRCKTKRNGRKSKGNRCKTRRKGRKSKKNGRKSKKR